MNYLSNEFYIYINGNTVLICRRVPHLKARRMEPYKRANLGFNLQASDPQLVMLAGVQAVLNELERDKIEEGKLTFQLPSSDIAEPLSTGECSNPQFERLWKTLFGKIKAAGHTIEAIEVDQTEADMMTEELVVIRERSEKPVKEVWKPWPTAPDRYEVSTLDQVRSFCKRGRKAKNDILRPFTIGGYRYVSIFIEEGARKKDIPVHQMVLETHVGPRPKGYWAAHYDDDPANNTLGNLRWDTPKSNWNDRRFTRPKGYTVERLEPNQEAVYFDHWTQKIAVMHG